MKITRIKKNTDLTRSDFSSLNANPDPQHFSYKILGLLSWGVLTFCFVALIAAPRLLLEVARVIAIYMMIRFIGFAVFYLVGLTKMKQTERHTKRRAAEGMVLESNVHHLVVIPNYAEPADILSRTLQALAFQAGAPWNMTVVLGMEEQEAGAAAKAEALLSEYKDGFSGLMTTIHPVNLPGETAGKAANETWAIRFARDDLSGRRKIPLDDIIVTIVDSDSIIHPHYFGELSRCFANDPNRYATVWQAPILLDSGIWLTHAAIRLITFFSNAISLGDYVNPLEAKSPYSTYSISLRLLEKVEYWDPTLLAEDVNIFMRVFYANGGKAFIRQIFLPVHGNPVYGKNLWHAIGIFFLQKVRQSWGGAEIGYQVQMWRHKPQAPFFQKLGRLMKLLHDHLFFSTAGFVVALGTVLSIKLDHIAVITLPVMSFSPPLFYLLNLIGGAAILAIWFRERIRLSRGRVDWGLKNLLGEVVSWVLFPILFLLLMNLPGLVAQTQMLLGRTIQFKRVPKGVNSKLGE